MIEPKRTTALLAACTLVLAANAGADTGPPLYVAEGGDDTGDCSSRSAPCATIGYALGVAGKNSQVRVAAGQYSIDDPADLIYMLSGAVNVTGGHIADGDFSPTVGDRSVISGVPLEYRALLSEKGFQVITDAKGLESDDRASQMLKAYQAAQVSAVAAPCSGGSASGFACNNVDLLSHVARSGISASPNRVADIWGFTDLNTNREYAIVGVSIGTVVFDVTNPEAPREIGFIDGQSATWRDIKVYQFFDAASNRWRAYAYVTTDGASNGLFVLDLSELPHAVRRVNYNSDFNSAHNVYLTGVDFGTGLAQPGTTPQLIAAGSGLSRGQFRSYSLSNPAAPAFQANVASAGYMHDAASLRIDDQRITGCAIAGQPCDVLVDFNEDQIEFWDVTNATNPTLLSRANRYANTGYVHSGWWSEDRQYIYAHDELDERNSGLPSTMRVFSIANLGNPTLAGTWTGPTGAVDHNGFVRGNRYYMSNYTRGLTVLDLSNPAAPTETGFFDTYGASDSANFAGAWGAYPFFHSGTVAVSDINSGLYLLRDQSLDVPQGRLSFAAASFATVEGQQAALQVSRSGGSAGTVTVDYEVLDASSEPSDYQALTGTLSWAPGNSADQAITIDAVADASNEGLERVLVRLVNPTGGATLGNSNVASLYLSDAGAASQVGFFDDDIAIAERGLGMAIVVVQRRGSAAGPASVDFSVSAGTAAANVDFVGPASGTVSWNDGDAEPRSIVFEISDDGLAESNESFQLTLANPQGASIAGAGTAAVTIEDGSGNNLAPNAIAGMNQTRPEGSNIVLDGSQSNDPDGDTLTYSWTQTGSGPAVTLANGSSSIAAFTAPSVSSDTLLQFQLEVTDPGGLASLATTSVTITDSGAGSGSGNGGGSGGGTTSGGLLAMLGALWAWRRRFSRTDCA